jgi:hypothetical protein
LATGRALALTVAAKMRAQMALVNFILKKYGWSLRSD